MSSELDILCLHYEPFLSYSLKELRIYFSSFPSSVALDPVRPYVRISCSQLASQIVTHLIAASNTSFKLR